MSYEEVVKMVDRYEAILKDDRAKLSNYVDEKYLNEVFTASFWWYFGFFVPIIIILFIVDIYFGEDIRISAVQYVFGVYSIEDALNIIWWLNTVVAVFWLLWVLWSIHKKQKAYDFIRNPLIHEAQKKIDAFVKSEIKKCDIDLDAIKKMIPVTEKEIIEKKKWLYKVKKLVN